jgi:hypothetical protein
MNDYYSFRFSGKSNNIKVSGSGYVSVPEGSPTSLVFLRAELAMRNQFPDIVLNGSDPARGFTKGPTIQRLKKKPACL